MDHDRLMDAVRYPASHTLKIIVKRGLKGDTMEPEPPR
jgi:hypothetical protein